VNVRLGNGDEQYYEWCFENRFIEFPKLFLDFKAAGRAMDTVIADVTTADVTTTTKRTRLQAPSQAESDDDVPVPVPSSIEAILGDLRVSSEESNHLDLNFDEDVDVDFDTALQSLLTGEQPADIQEISQKFPTSIASGIEEGGDTTAGPGSAAGRYLSSSLNSYFEDANQGFEMSAMSLAKFTRLPSYQDCLKEIEEYYQTLESKKRVKISIASKESYSRGSAGINTQHTSQGTRHNVDDNDAQDEVEGGALLLPSEDPDCPMPDTDVMVIGQPYSQIRRGPKAMSIRLQGAYVRIDDTDFIFPTCSFSLDSTDFLH